MKVCNYCKKEKAEIYFYSGHKTCVKCSKYKSKKNKEWRKRNIKEIAKYRKKWYADNPSYYKNYRKEMNKR